MANKWQKSGKVVSIHSDINTPKAFKAARLYPDGVAAVPRLLRQATAGGHVDAVPGGAVAPQMALVNRGETSCSSRGCSITTTPREGVIWS